MASGESLERFGRNVGERRQVLELSVYDVAAATGIPIDDLVALERGRRDVALEELMALASALGVPPSRLVQSVSR